MSNNDDYAPAGKRRTKATKAEANEMTKATKAESVERPEQEQDGSDPVSRRIAEERERRRGRSSQDQGGFNQKLSVPVELKDPRATYRWVTDRATRLMEMATKGWQPVSNEMIAKSGCNTGVGSVTQRVVNERTTNTAENGILMWKPKEFYQEDKAAEQDRIRELEQAMERGDTRDPKGLSGAHAYVPEGGIRIKHGK